MKDIPPHHAVSGPAAVLAFANAILFALGALLHSGVAVWPLKEPVVASAMIIEAFSALALAIGTVGLFTGAAWTLRLARIASLVALAAVVIISLILMFDGRDSTAGNAALLTARGILSVVTLIALARGRRIAVRH